MQQFVTFILDDNLVGIDILDLREINQVLDITPVQHAPAHVRGLINLRGQTVTVFDLGIRLGLGPRIITADTHNVILKKDWVGLMVDNIADVISVDDDAIEPTPANINGIDAAFIHGVVNVENDLLVVLSAPSILES